MKMFFEKTKSLYRSTAHDLPFHFGGPAWNPLGNRVPLFSLPYVVVEQCG